MSEKKRVIALGFFDGVHIGHAALINKTKERAAEKNAIPTVMSFDIHPDNIVRGVSVPLINGTEGRNDILNRYFGITSVIYIHFDRKMMCMPWRDFLDSLIRELDVCHFVVGDDFRFGYRGEGNPEKLREYCCAKGLGYDVIPSVKIDGVTVSSTIIRDFISVGDMEKARLFLGHPYTLIDTVRYGYQLGTKLGTPTINMQFQDGVLVPRYGVYAVKANTDKGDEYIAVTNIGVRPTISGDNHVSVESFILDFQGNLYDHRVRLDFYAFLREEKKFDDILQLKDQILKDVQHTKEYFEKEC